jgi:hypothetical protein
MTFRRTIAAFLVFVLAGLIASPALAPMASCAVDDSEGCCCCAKKDLSEVQTVAKKGCDCAACACAFERSDASAPFYPTAESKTPMILAATLSPSAPLEFTEVEPLDRTLAALDARGPPRTRRAPLYLLYDTFLI